MRKLLTGLLIFALAITGQSLVYACCGTAMSQYESVQESNPYYTIGTDAAVQYLQLQGITDTSAQNTAYDFHPPTDPSNQNKWGEYVLNVPRSLLNYVRVVFWYDNDANYQNDSSHQVISAGVEFGNHTFCTISADCNLTSKTATQAAQAAFTSCGHHKCHWEQTILPAVNAASNSNPEGS